MKNTIAFILVLLISFSLASQTATNLTHLETPTLDETSGLLFYNNKLISFNDSGNEAELYEIDIISGAIVRTIIINNATNIDWEDIAQDSSYIYIGDFGNNAGNRTNLKIHRISKEDFDEMDNSATAETISFSYLDQIDFTPQYNNTNWDAEGMIVYKGRLMIFSKNWTDNTVNVYSIPKTIGSHIAEFESSFNTNGLITGADISPDESQIYLCGYSTTQAPFLYTINDIPVQSFDIFSGKISDKIANITPYGNQIEGIAVYDTTPTLSFLYLSNEKLSTSNGTNPIVFPAKLWSIEVEKTPLNLTSNNIENSINIHPNPLNTHLKLSTIVEKVIIYDAFGNVISKHFSVDEIQLNMLKKGVYFAHIYHNDVIQIKKLIKN
ncbi:T9SS type A sorting domain-containing protein [Brumimicrobium oceani]|uniref:Secretion system C-terminal sorting domain-containing protein n=1 Tax=Brumimicrobium oceani TaxID=2100725 RepID=A0A2U2XH72_9FLAO|nr:T9SS type A sorting domain-containing protein [Brumimicrobium oceani]PWH87146.1 hypothetical protein DIT68_02470 [Brumimicrobium oceani]